MCEHRAAGSLTDPAVNLPLEKWRLNPWSATTAIRSFSSPELVKHALALMREGHVETSVFHCSAAMNSCRECNGWTDAIGILNCMQQENIPYNEITHNVALSSFADGSKWANSFHHLNFMRQTAVEPTPVSFSSVLAAVSREGLWQEALTIFFEMQREMLRTDVMCFNTIISACGRGGQWLLAIDLLDQLKSSMQPTDSSYSATISACEKAFKWQHAVALLQDMGKTLPDSRKCYNAAISACEKCGHWHVALSLLQQMAEARILRDRVTCNAAIGACAKSASWPSALSLLESMPVSALQPGTITYNTVITVCENGLQWRLVLELTDTSPGVAVSDSEPTELHHAIWRLTKQPPSRFLWEQGEAAAKRASGMVGKFRPKKLVSLLRALASMLVTEEALYLQAAETLTFAARGAGLLQAQELANLCWAYAVVDAPGSSAIFQAVQEAFIERRKRVAADAMLGLKLTKLTA
ncbi:Pentatricopeptide repeat-containing protein, chloroplastic [Symbiodinium microadriaticum]|uniref:Pentatricopeptide repeat-containing protein, chloroplastic n=1 Tax=Symbiodinium microadriaticum TaxID=2951 RepID=A0A1Q9DNY8_SYMMI|nr:Pentatricopeptide repeat-containing protein, chloroplastic [Symbiodinium microadriaticum]CAE7241608.1 unnamed protein product [Symbiodinium sp. KB8]